MLNVPGWFRSTSADAAVALLCSCRTGLLGRSQQQISSQHTLWPAQFYSTAKDGSEKRSKYKRVRDPPDPQVIAAMLKDAAPVQPTHRILKVIMQSEVPLTSHQVFDKVREEFGTAAFPTRRGFKGHMHKIQHLMWVQSQPKPRQQAVAGDAGTIAAALVTKPKKKKGKSAAASEPYVYMATHRALQVDLNEPGSPEQQEARAVADKWTSKNLSKYTDMLWKRKVPVTLDNYAMVPRATRRLFERDVK